MGYAHGDKQYRHNMHQPTGKLDTSSPTKGPSGVKTKFEADFHGFVKMYHDSKCKGQFTEKQDVFHRLTLDDKLDKIKDLASQTSKIMYSDHETAKAYMRYATELCSGFGKDMDKNFHHRCQLR